LTLPQLTRLLEGETVVLLPLAHLPPAGWWGCHAKPQLEVHEACSTDRATTTDTLVMRYLRAFGPARPRDMSTWCGLTHLGASFDRLRPQLVTFVDEKGHEYFDLPRAPRPAADSKAPPRLLGPWEALLLSYEDRSRFLRDEYRQAVFTSNGIVRGAL
jgi:Winged helix DNA-binding domain